MIKVGDICRTNLSQLGGLVKILYIVPYSDHDTKLYCGIEHIEDHSYGYKKGDKGGYMLEDLIFVRES